MFGLISRQTKTIFYLGLTAFGLLACGGPIADPYDLDDERGGAPFIRLSLAGVQVYQGGEMDLGTIPVGNTTTVEFMVENIGTGDLVVSGSPRVSISSVNFQLESDVPGRIEPMSMGLFSVSVLPQASGGVSAAIALISNDEQFQSFNFTISGQAGSQDTSAAIMVLDDAQQTISAGTEVDFGAQPIGQEFSREFTIINLSLQQLELTDVTLNGIGFSLQSPGNDMLTGGGESIFTITFTPSQLGPYGASVTITHAGSNSPFSFAVVANGGEEEEQGQPDILLRQGTETIANGQTAVSIGSTETGEPLLTTFALVNVGGEPLELYGELYHINVSGEAFSLHTDAVSPVAASTGSHFVIRFDPSEPGTHTGSVSFASNDPQDGSFQFTISGSASGSTIVDQPEIELLFGSQAIVSGTGSVDAGQLLVGGTELHNFTIANNGAADLVLGSEANAILLVGDSAFSIGSQPAGTVTPGDESSFSVRFTPLSVGSYSATVTIMSNDPLCSPFTFEIQGLGSEIPTGGSSGTVDLSGYTVELHQNYSWKVVTIALEGEYEHDSYIVLVRDRPDISTWADDFSPALSTAETEKIALFVETDPQWQNNDVDDEVKIVDPDGVVVDKTAGPKDAIKTRKADASFELSATTSGANNAPATLDAYSQPLYIYEVAERGDDTRLLAFEGNYVLIYIP